MYPLVCQALLFVFFFQAEDGIRGTSVTGVQTCALPIWSRSPLARRWRTSDLIKTGGANVSPVEIETALLHHPGLKVAHAVGVPDPLLGEGVEIGRASCRERGWTAVGDVAWKKRKDHEK